MTHIPALNWALVAVSLFNMIVLAWLGLTIALNAARPRWGIWLAGAVVAGGGLFFAGHAAVVSGSFDLVNANLQVWWPLGWIPVIALPYCWYGMTLWYAGFITGNDNYSRMLRVPYVFAPRRRPEALAFVLATALTVFVLLSFLASTPLPANAAATPLIELLPAPWWIETRPGAGLRAVMPLFAIAYPVNIVLCMLLSILALRRPEPAGRAQVDGDGSGLHARRRAQPWLMATSALLLIVSLCVAAGLLWVFDRGASGTLAEFYAGYTVELAAFDLGVSSLISAAVICLGRGIVAYEVFSGHLLPRHELRRNWRNVCILAAGLALAISAALTLRVRPVFGAVVAAAVIAVFYALLNWRSAMLRDRHIAALTRRPVTVARALGDPDDGRAAAQAEFSALCAGVLRARRGYLLPLGTLAPLLAPQPAMALKHPADAPDLIAAPAIAADADAPAPFANSTFQPVAWSVPLHGSGGLAGVLLLGAGADDGLYTHEQLEIARAHAERLLDVWASRNLTQRLMALQRDRMAESGVADRRFRRVVHDEVLPRVHAALLTTSDADAVRALSAVHRDLSGLLRELPTAATHERGLTEALRKLLAEEFVSEFDQMTVEFSPEAEAVAYGLPTVAAEVLYYAAREAVRNAARYGRGKEQRTLHLQMLLNLSEGRLLLTVADNGVGLNAAVDAPDDRAHGLTLHSTMLAVIGGELRVAGSAGQGTRVMLQAPRG